MLTAVDSPEVRPIRRAFITGIDINSRSSSGRDVVAMYKRGAATVRPCVPTQP